jgi:hypothetical protein
MIGKECLGTAGSLLRAAWTKIDRRIGGQLQALAKDYERQAKKAARADAAKAFVRLVTNGECAATDRFVSIHASVDDLHEARDGAQPRRIVMGDKMALFYSGVRKWLVSLAVIGSTLTTAPTASAQDQTSTHHGTAAASNETELEFIVDNDLAISKMSLDMSKVADPTGDVDRDFVALMMPRHRAAIDMGSS